jgi:hypothetical protein
VSYEVIASYGLGGPTTRQQSGGFTPYANVESVEMDGDMVSGGSPGSVWVTGSLMEVEAHKGPLGLPNCLSLVGYQALREQDRARRARNRDLPFSMRENEMEVPYCEAPPPHNRGYEPWYPDDIANSLHGKETLHCFHLGNGGEGRLQYTLVLSKTRHRRFRRVGICAWNPYNVDVQCQQHILERGSPALIMSRANLTTIKIV